MLESRRPMSNKVPTKFFYRLQLVRFAPGRDPQFPGMKMPVEQERGDFYSKDGTEVEFFGYVNSLNFAAKLNVGIGGGWRYVPVERGYEKSSDAHGDALVTGGAKPDTNGAHDGHGRLSSAPPVAPLAKPLSVAS